MPPSTSWIDNARVSELIAVGYIVPLALVACFMSVLQTDAIASGNPLAPLHEVILCTVGWPVVVVRELWTLFYPHGQKRVPAVISVLIQQPDLSWKDCPEKAN